MRFSVSYPSGSEFTVAGELRCGRLPGSSMFAVGVIQHDGEIVMLDPRAIVTDSDGEVVYDPRQIPLDVHEPAMIEWLLDNPEWAAS
jgi:hypothetical protein